MQRSYKTVVWVRTTFVAYHRWRGAPDEVGFLRDFHRHVFHVRLGVAVTHDNRDVEFFTLKADLNTHLASHYAGQRFELSCEQIAVLLLQQFRAEVCEVSEDGENGATVFATNRVEKQ